MRTRILVLFFGFLLVLVNSLPQAGLAEDSSTVTTADDNADKMTENSGSNNNGNAATAGTAIAASTTDVQSEVANATDDKVVNESSEGDGKGDEELPDGMSESLADFVLDILKAQLSNATKPAAETPSSETNTTHPLPSDSSHEAASDNSTTSSQSDDGMTGGQTESKEAEKTDDTSSGGESSGEDGWSSKEYVPSMSTQEPFSKNGRANCDVPVDLNNYCIIGDLVLAYFKDDMTSNGLRDPIFDMDIVRRLMSCPLGEWCLGNEIDVFKNMQKRFYDGPLCKESMWECFFDIMVQREECKDKEFLFIVDAADLMCGLFQTPPTEEKEKECFAHALAALHVTYAGFLANNMSVPAPQTEAVCEGYSFRMTKTYLCADEHCDAFFDSGLAMEEFGRWNWFMGNVEKVVAKCGIDDTCGALEDRTPVSKSWFGMTSPSTWPESTSSVHYSQFPDTDHDGLDTDDRLTEEDESLMVALSVATAVGLLFMVLGLVFWRRNRRRNLYYYRTEGYGKVPGDEAHLLSRSSD